MIPVELDAVSVTLDGQRIVEDVSAVFTGGSWTTIIGPNGAGKTTLLRSIARLANFEGRIAVDSRELASMRRREVARLVAYVPQQPLIPRAMTVGDYALMGRTPYIPYLGVETPADIACVTEVLDRLDLGELGDRLLGSLSGGELQRVVLARALAQEAPVLLLDEPTSALDVGHQQQVLELVDRLRHERSLTVISAMHDLTLAAQYAEAMLLMDGGRVVATGSPEEVLTEATIESHYDARVTVFREGGELIVAPRRRPQESRS